VSDPSPRYREVRQQQIAIAALLFLLALAAPLIDAPSLWPLVALGGAVSGLLLWGALGHESIASPVVALVLTTLPSMYAADRPAVGSLAGVVLALALGEHLAACRHVRYGTPGRSDRPIRAASVGLHGAAALGAVVLTMVATALPQARVWSATAIVAIGVLGLALQRRRAAMPEIPLPPPDQLL
jgi:hypothetical protein